ncbi:hypothetical protein B0H13DRAFT_2016546 [Mycena leptocephala]|nr:hypothetical protein B0H13DRAFT_2016546 [Mycena leptocephala]
MSNSTVVKSNATSHKPFGDSPTFQNEWVLNSSGQRIFWVPPWQRTGLSLSRNTLTICTQGTTKLDFSQFVHGTEWEKCFDPAFKNAQ